MQYQPVCLPLSYLLGFLGKLHFHLRNYFTPKINKYIKLRSIFELARVHLGQVASRWEVLLSLPGAGMNNCKGPAGGR